MNALHRRISLVVDVRSTADAARLGRWLMGFQGTVLAGAGWWLQQNERALLSTLGVSAGFLLVAGASSRLPWPRWHGLALALYPVGSFGLLVLLGRLAPGSGTAYVSFLTLWFMYVGLVGRTGSGLRLLPLAALTWGSLQPQLGSEQVLRLVLASLVWVTLSDVLALRATNHRQRTDQLELAVETDPLTQLPNRRALEHALARLEPGDVLVVVDLDHFKQLNDRGGHAYGDSVLVEFAHTLASVVRGSDVVARFGGEEFVLVLPQGNRQGLGAASVVARLRGRWAQLHPDITWSAGASCHVDGSAPEATLREADRALYRAKADGRDRVVVSGDARELVGIATDRPAARVG